MHIVLVLLVHLPIDDPGGHEVDRGKRGAVYGSWFSFLMIDYYYHYYLQFVFLLLIIIIIIIIIGKWQRGSWAGEQTPELGVLVKSGIVLMIVISFIIIKYPVCTLSNKEP